MNLYNYFELKVAGNLDLSSSFEKITDKKVINAITNPDTKLNDKQKEMLDRIKDGEAYAFDAGFDSYYFYAKGNNESFRYILNLTKLRGKRVYYLVEFKSLSGDMKFTERVPVNTHDLFSKIFKILRKTNLKNFAFEGAKEKTEKDSDLSARDKLYIRILAGNGLVPSKDSLVKQKIGNQSYLTFSLS